MFATHPSIEERLRRIFGKSVALLDAPELIDQAPVSDRLPDIDYATVGLVDVAPTAMPMMPAPGPVRRLPDELMQAVRESHSACALVYALLLEPGSGRKVQMALLNTYVPQQSVFIAGLVDVLARLPKSVRLPLLDLAMPALKQLTLVQRADMLAMVDRLIRADQRLTLAEFVIQTVLTRRLDARAARATPVAFSDVTALKPECTLLLSLVAHVTATSLGVSASGAFMRAAAGCPTLGLSSADLLDAAMIGFHQVRLALERANQLAPLAKPALVKALLAAVGETHPMPVAIADLMRAVCAAIEAPIPPAVEATYTLSDS